MDHGLWTMDYGLWTIHHLKQTTMHTKNIINAAREHCLRAYPNDKSPLWIQYAEEYDLHLFMSRKNCNQEDNDHFYSWYLVRHILPSVYPANNVWMPLEEEHSSFNGFDVYPIEQIDENNYEHVHEAPERADFWRAYVLAKGGMIRIAEFTAEHTAENWITRLEDLVKPEGSPIFFQFTAKDLTAATLQLSSWYSGI